MGGGQCRAGEQIRHSGYQVLPMTEHRDKYTLIYGNEMCAEVVMRAGAAAWVWGIKRRVLCLVEGGLPSIWNIQ